MKHKTKIKSLCCFLIQGHGINEALAELGLTPTYLDRLRRSDRVRLHQAHQIFREGLQRDLANRARLGRHTGTLKRVIDDLPFLALPGDDEDQEREHRKWHRRNFKDEDAGEVIIPHNGSYIDAPFPEKLSQIREGDLVDDEDEDDPAVEATPAPRRRLQTNETPFAAPSSRPPPEDATQRRPEPEPAPELHWYRLFTGRAVQRDGDGKVVRSAMPGAYDYPSPTRE